MGEGYASTDRGTAPVSHIHFQLVPGTAGAIFQHATDVPSTTRCASKVGRNRSFGGASMASTSRFTAKRRIDDRNTGVHA